MPTLKLYFAPGTCSRVSLIALEQTGIAFETALVKMMAGEHKSPDYLELHPQGKIPVLTVDGTPLTETVAILLYLAEVFPGTRLLPLGSGPLSDAAVVADLAWCSSTIHPLVTRLRIPDLFCDRPEGRGRVWELAAQAMAVHFALIDRRLARRRWMLGEWSMVDAFVLWIWDQAAASGFDVSRYPNFADHVRRALTQEPVRRAMHRELEAEQWLDQQGLKPRFPPPPGRE